MSINAVILPVFPENSAQIHQSNIFFAIWLLLVTGLVYKMDEEVKKRQLFYELEDALKEIKRIENIRLRRGYTRQ